MIPARTLAAIMLFAAAMPWANPAHADDAAIMRAFPAAAPWLASIRADEAALGRYPDQRDRFFEPEGRPVACALLIHGLNTLPTAMDALAAMLASQGVLVFRTALAGHGCPPEAFTAAGRERWLSDARRAWAVVTACADALDVPALAVGFSLGGLVIVDLERSDPGFRPDGVILLAPASAVRARVNLLRVPAALGLSVRSRAPSAYRSADRLPAEAYRALFACVDRLGGRPLPVTAPCLVIVDPGDFLVDARALERAAAILPACRYVTVDAAGSVPGGRHHLLLDPESAGTAAWAVIRRETAAFVASVIGRR